MAEKRDRIIFTLAAGERDLLEAHRVRLGLRTYADTLRALLKQSPPKERVPLYQQLAEAAPMPEAPAPSERLVNTLRTVQKRKPIGFTVTGEPIYR